MPKKPRKGESKQEFFRRCAQEIQASGASQEEALSACAANWNQARLIAFVDEGRAHLEASVSLEAASENKEAARRFSILAYTGKVIDWGWLGKFVIDLSGMSLAKPTVPSLRNHSLDRIVGTIDKSAQDENGFYVFGGFSRVTPDAREVLDLAEEGFPWQASIGVEAQEVLHLERGATREVNGLTVEGPLDVWLKTSVFETSFCPFGADDDTAAVAMSAGGENKNSNHEEVQMNKKMRALLKRLGLSATATDKEALDFMAKVDPEKLEKELQAEPGGMSEEDAAKLVKDAVKKANAEVVILERERVEQINEAVDSVNLSRKIADELISEGTPIDQAREKIITELAKTNKPVGPGSLEMGEAARDKLVLAAVDGLSIRAGVRLEKPAPGHEAFRGKSLSRIAEECLVQHGVDTRNMSPKQVADTILGRNRRSLSMIGESRDDFSNIISNTAERILLKAWQIAPSTWEAWCAAVSAKDFKPMQGLNISDLPTLELVNENGEYNLGHLSDMAESYSVLKYGKLFALTWEMIVNDDLRAFARIPQGFGNAARRKDNELVYDKLAGVSWTMSDGKALFHADHGNLEGTTGYKGPVDSDALSSMRKNMRTQTTPAGALMNIPPKFVLVPAEQETALDILLRSVASTDSEKNAGVYNPWYNSLTPIVEGYLDGKSVNAWYGVADPNAIEHFEVAHLDGKREPEVFEREVFNVDGLQYKVRHVVGVGCMGFRGLWKNPGA